MSAATTPPGRRAFEVASRRGEWHNRRSGNDCEDWELGQALDVVAGRPGPSRTRVRGHAGMC